MSSTKDEVPVFKSWKGWYTLLLAAFVLMLLGLYLFNQAYT